MAPQRPSSIQGKKVSGMGQGVDQSPGTGLDLGEGTASRQHQPEVLREPESSRGGWVGWTHKSSNGSSIPGGHSRKGDHQKDDDGTDTAEEVLGWGGSGCSVREKLEGKGIPLIP